MELYDHQVECVKAVENQFNQGSKRTLAVLATGTGKTIIYLHLVDKWAKAGARILILAHRRELIHQPIERAEEFYPELAKRMGIVMANLDESDAQVIVATIQTVARDRLVDVEFDYVVLDECHHSTATTYLKMVERFKDSRWLGMTATPFRTDGDSLSKVFDSVAYRLPITAAIDRKMLVPFNAFGFSLPVSFKGIKETADGWAEEPLGGLLSAENALEVVYKKWSDYCEDRITLCFTASVAQAHATAKYFEDRFVRAEAVDGTTPKKKRDRILELFRAGEVQVVCNCQVWTEGVDVPEASAALMVCPTKSDLAYVQKLGRVLRIFPGKKDAIILDFAPIEDRNVIMAGDILGVPRREKVAKEKAERAGLMIGASRIDDHGLIVSVDPTAVVVEALKYLRKGSLAWSFKDYMTVAALSDVATLAIELPNVVRLAKAEKVRGSSNWNDEKERLYLSLLQHRLWMCRKEGRYWCARFVGGFESMDEAIKQSETFVDSNYLPALAKKRRQWRNRPVSEPQMRYMKRLGVSPPVPCNQGQAAQLISHEITRRAIERVRVGVEFGIMKGE